MGRTGSGAAGAPQSRGKGIVSQVHPLCRPPPPSRVQSGARNAGPVAPHHAGPAAGPVWPGDPQAEEQWGAV